MTDAVKTVAEAEPDQLEFSQTVERLVAIVMSGESTVEELDINPELAEAERGRLREAVREKVDEAKRSEDVVGGMAAGKGGGGYRNVTIGGVKFVGDVEETAPQVREHLESINDLGPAEVAKLMELASDGERKYVVFQGNRFSCAGFGDDGTFYLDVRYKPGSRDWDELGVIIEIQNGYGKVKAINDKNFTEIVSNPWIKEFLSGCEIVGVQQ